MKVSISLSFLDELINYIDTQVGDRSQLVENLLQIWRKQQEEQSMIQACLLLDRLNEEDDKWQQAAIMDWEASGL